jgi:5-methylcytosine-specific restriction endonuclease McrA
VNPEDDLNISHEDLRTILTRPIAFYRLFAEVAGSAEGGVFLSQLYYWSNRTSNPDGWIYKTANEWHDETRLSRRCLEAIRKGLKSKGVIREKLAGVPATVHYKIEWAPLFHYLQAFLRHDGERARVWYLRTMPYQEYLQTPEWKAIREKKLKESGFRCQLCNQSGELNVHHRTYERRGNEELQDLIVLCRGCHETFHGIMAEPEVEQ